jgi:hypothetical protein
MVFVQILHFLAFMQTCMQDPWSNSGLDCSWHLYSPGGDSHLHTIQLARLLCIGQSWFMSWAELELVIMRVMQILSSSSNCTMEEVAAAGPGVRFFQLYVSWTSPVIKNCPEFVLAVWKCTEGGTPV